MGMDKPQLFQLSPADWRSHVLACQPDIVFALSDTPFTDPPYSQKRLTKSIERSANWLAALLKPVDPPPPTELTSVVSEPPPREFESPTHPLNILLHMSGGTSIPARRAFADSLLEVLYGPEADAIQPLKTLVEGVKGYTFDLVPLRQSLEAEKRKKIGLPAMLLPSTTPNSVPLQNAVEMEDHIDEINSLLKASLLKTPPAKLRLINSTEGPHEILELITEVGVDMFDAQWAQRAADIGVALDFEFPVRHQPTTEKKREVGHNLYDESFALDFGTLADSFQGVTPAYISAATGSSNASSLGDIFVCPCAACSPATPSQRIYHGVDNSEFTSDASSSVPSPQPHYTRAYIHHLLHTHEMGAHSFLVMHNLEVLEKFFEGVRGVIEGSESAARSSSSKGMTLWDEEVKTFAQAYDEPAALFGRARESWRKVDLARGKGRLAREKETDA